MATLDLNISSEGSIDAKGEQLDYFSLEPGDTFISEGSVYRVTERYTAYKLSSGEEVGLRKLNRVVTLCDVKLNVTW